MSYQLTIEYPEDILADMGLTPTEFSKEAKFLLGAKLYETGRLTSGQAARLCNMQRIEFLQKLSQSGMRVSNLHVEDADAELEFGCNG